MQLQGYGPTRSESGLGLGLLGKILLKSRLELDLTDFAPQRGLSVLFCQKWIVYGFQT